MTRDAGDHEHGTVYARPRLGKGIRIENLDVHPLPYVLVTPANVPATDKWPYEDFAPFFTDRWKTAGVAVS